MSEEQNRLNETEGPEQPVVTRSYNPKTDTGLLKCPKCDSSDIRTRSGVASFFVIIMGLAGILLLMLLRNCLVLLPLKHFLLIFSFAIMFSLCVISAEVWLLLFRSSRCKSCGHGFRSIPQWQREQTTQPFPWRFYFLNSILLLLVGLTSPIMLEVLFNDTFQYFLIKVAFAVFSCGLLSLLSLPFQGIFYELLRKKIKNELQWAILFLIPAFLLGGISLYQSLPRVRARTVLSDGRLAALPESATDIKVYSWSFIFSGESFMKFSANPEDINVFLNSSPSINGQQCQRYSLERMRLPYPKDSRKLMEYNEAGHELFIPDSMAPDWYDTQIRIRGRSYEIPPEGHHNNGEVIVDDENNVVYINVIWS